MSIGNQMANAFLASRSDTSKRLRVTDGRQLQRRPASDVGRMVPVWSSRPLCSRYLAVFIARQHLPALEARAVAHKEVRWAYGLTPNGEGELLGLWFDPPQQDLTCARLFADLKIRGVERVTLVVELHEHETKQNVESGKLVKERWSARGLFSCSPTIDEPPISLSDQSERFVKRGSKVVRSLSAYFGRSMRRRKFADQEPQQVCYLAWLLEQADRRVALVSARQRTQARAH